MNSAYFLSITFCLNTSFQSPFQLQNTQSKTNFPFDDFLSKGKRNVMLGHPNTASKCTQTSNRSARSKRQTARWTTAPRRKTCHTTSARAVLAQRVQANGSLLSSGVSECVRVVGGGCVWCSGVIVDRRPLKPLYRTDSCLVCTPVAGGAKPPTLHLSLALSIPPFFQLSISFILPLPSSPSFLSLTGLYKSSLFRTD